MPKMTKAEMDAKLAYFETRMLRRTLTPDPCAHVWGPDRSRSGRKVCTRCGYVTDQPCETLGVAEGSRK